MTTGKRGNHRLPSLVQRVNLSQRSSEGFRWPGKYSVGMEGQEYLVSSLHMPSVHDYDRLINVKDIAIDKSHGFTDAFKNLSHYKSYNCIL